MLQLHGMKVICLTAGGLTDEGAGNKPETRSKASCEKSAKAIVDTETSLP
jgi:hypothetical protein